MDTQEKFTAALRKLCEERDLELIVEDTYAHSGFFSLQHPDSFEAVLRFPFDFRTGFSSFVEGIGDPGRGRHAPRRALTEPPGERRAGGSGAMSGAATLAPPATGVGALEIDEVRRSASVGGAELYLSDAEFRLLSALASEPGRVFSHAELGEICFVGILKIERCAERLARKLELRGIEGQLRRVPGAGLALGAGAEAIGALR